MDIPFPETTPRFIDSKWFSADTPCDEDAELTALEQSKQNWFSSVGQQFKARVPLGKTDPEPMEECESEEEEVNPYLGIYRSVETPYLRPAPPASPQVPLSCSVIGFETDSVQIVEDSDEVEEEAEPPNMNHDVDLLQIHEESGSRDDEAGNLCAGQEVTHKTDHHSEDTDLESDSPPSTVNWACDDRNVCTPRGDIAGNEESDDSEDSHDEDEEEDLQPIYPPPRSDLQGRTLDLADSSEPNLSDQSTLWP